MAAGLSFQKESSGSGDISTTLIAEELYQRDPLLVLLKHILRLNNLLITIGVILLTGAVVFGLAALGGTRFELQGPNLGNTLRATLQTFVIFPLLSWLFLLIPDAIASLFNTLHSNSVIGAPRQDQPGSEPYPDFLIRLVSWESSGWWVLGAWAFVVLYWLYRLLIVDPTLGNHSSLWLQIAILLIYSPMMYAVLLSFIRLLIALVFANRLFRTFTIQVNPLDTDGYAGLGILGRILILSVALLVTVAVASLVMNGAFLFGAPNIFSILEAIVLTLFYLAMIPILLFGWLFLPHQVMQEARDSVLESLATEFQQAIVQTTPAPNDDAATIKAGTDRLSELQRRYQFLQDTYPTWPLEVRQIRRLVATVSLPALFTLLWPFISRFLPAIGSALNSLLHK